MLKTKTAPFEFEPLILNDKIVEDCAARGGGPSASRPSDRRAGSQTARSITATYSPRSLFPPTRNVFNRRTNTNMKDTHYQPLK